MLKKHKLWGLRLVQLVKGIPNIGSVVVVCFFSVSVAVLSEPTAGFGAFVFWEACVGV